MLELEILSPMKFVGMALPGSDASMVNVIELVGIALAVKLNKKKAASARNLFFKADRADIGEIYIQDPAVFKVLSRFRGYFSFPLASRVF